MTHIESIPNIGLLTAILACLLFAAIIGILVFIAVVQTQSDVIKDYKEKLRFIENQLSDYIGELSALQFKLKEATEQLISEQKKVAELRKYNRERHDWHVSELKKVRDVYKKRIVETERKAQEWRDKYDSRIPLHGKDGRFISKKAQST